MNKNNINLPVFNIIVFGDQAILKEVTSSIDVVNMDTVLSIIEKFPDLVVSDEVITSTYNLFESISLKGEEAEAEHLAYAQSFSDDYTTIGSVSRDYENVNQSEKYEDNSSGKVILTILLGLGAFLIGRYFTVIAFLFLLLFIPSKSRKRKKYRRKSSSMLALILIMIFLGIITKNMGGKELELTQNDINNASQISTDVNKQTSPEKKEDVALSSFGDVDGVDEHTASLDNTPSSNVQTNVEESDDVVEYASDEVSEESQITDQVINENTSSLEIELEELPEEDEYDLTVEENNLSLQLGIDSNMVTALLGEPESINGSKWYYQNSYIELNDELLVIGWQNIYDQLSDVMLNPNGGTLLLGDSSDSVLDALGSPNQISYINPYKWIYNNSYVEFNKSWEVIGWTNIYDQLSDVMLKPNGGTLLLGDNSDTILDALGSPKQISYINPYKWIYNNSYVEFNKAWEVIGWTIYTINYRM